MNQAASSSTLDEKFLRYPGWSVTGAAFAGVMVSFAPIVPYTFSLFLNPLHTAFGWKREALSGAFALAAITVALVSPLIGLLLDRFPPRRILLPAILIFAATLASLSGLGPSIGRFYLTYFVLGLVANGTAQFAYTRTVLTWFDRHRGFALALILTGSGVGSLFIPPLTQWMIEAHGWRNAYLMLGALALLGLPLTALLVRNRPQPGTLDAAHASVPGAKVSEALASPAFWVLAGIILLGAFSENGLVTNLAAVLTEHGVSPYFAALALSARGGAGIVGRLGTGLLIDRFSPQRIQTCICCSPRPASSCLRMWLRRLPRLLALRCSAWVSAARPISRPICWRGISAAATFRCSTDLRGRPTQSAVQRGLWSWGTYTIAWALTSRVLSS